MVIHAENEETRSKVQRAYYRRSISYVRLDGVCNISKAKTKQNRCVPVSF